MWRKYGRPPQQELYIRRGRTWWTWIIQLTWELQIHVNFFSAIGRSKLSMHPDPRGLLSPCQPTCLSQLLHQPIFHDIITIIYENNNIHPPQLSQFVYRRHRDRMAFGRLLSHHMDSTPSDLETKKVARWSANFSGLRICRDILARSIIWESVRRQKWVCTIGNILDYEVSTLLLFQGSARI